jgi:STE24 endopeptidase
MALQLVMIVIVPMFIQPWFNKFTPLEAGSLRDRLLGLASRAKFGASQVFVVDGSRRSGHSNAYFTGFGRFRRIVLFDTLIAQLGEEELEAVLAHEIGHYKLGHIPRMLLMAAVFSLGAFWLIGWVASSPEFFAAFGIADGSVAVAFLLFALMSGLVSFWFSPLVNVMSRRHEYQADSFARRVMDGPGALVGALRKLVQKNLSNLTPHPLFSGFYHSHPTLAERERALKLDGG